MQSIEQENITNAERLQIQYPCFVVFTFLLYSFEDQTSNVQYCHKKIIGR